MVPLAAAWNRVLAGDVSASADVPEFARSTMDGYAVRARDTFGAGPGSPAWLTVSGEVAMGEAARVPLGPGQVMRIATGGMLPPGADAVVMLEYTQELADQTLEIYRSVAPGENVVQRGEDVSAGTVLLPAGRRLRPQDVGLLAALGVAEVSVRRRPRVAIIGTGDEIVPVTSALQPGQMRDANSYALAAQVAAMGGEPILLGLVPDRLEASGGPSAGGAAGGRCDPAVRRQFRGRPGSGHRRAPVLSRGRYSGARGGSQSRQTDDFRQN